MTPLAEYFQEKIERRVAFYESRVQQIDDKYLAEIEKLAARTSDRALADFFREAMQPKNIAAELQVVQALSRAGEIIDADRLLERLQTRLELVERHLRHPYFRAGAATKRGGKKAAALRWNGRADVHEQMRNMYEQKRKKGTKGEARKAVAQKFGVSEKTVRNALAGKTNLGK